MVFSRVGDLYGLLAALAAILSLAGCGNGSSEKSKVPSNDQAAMNKIYPFKDVTVESGVDFTHFNGMTGQFYLPEIMGAGGALLDYDLDGDLDLYLIQGHLLDADKKLEDAVFQPESLPLRDRFFRNDTQTSGPLRFTDVTDECGVNGLDYGMGAAVGDYNNDGYPDLYVTNFGPNRLWKNNGDGTFTDTTDQAGAQDLTYSVSASWSDYDGDGNLDLFIGNYTDFSVDRNMGCYARFQDYCHPTVYDALPDRLLRNKGDGTFEDVSQSSGITSVYGRALGVAGADFNGDQLLDFYVACDTTANQLWLNQGDGTFRETALLAGCALNEMGKAEASMGVDAADFDGDGDVDLFMTHNRNETNTVYVNDGKGFFSDRSVMTGLGAPSLPYAGFGTAWFDYDNDGLLDLFCANGAVVSVASDLPPGDPFPYHQRNQLFRNLGGGKFQETTREAGPAFALSEVSRGTLFGDLDNDGDMDLVVTNNSGPTRVFLNNLDNGNHWLGLRLLDPVSGRHLLGTRVEVLRKDQPSLWRRSRSDASYASSNDPRVLIGLGPENEPVDLKVHWPNGAVETWMGLNTNRWHDLIKGKSPAVSQEGSP